MIRCSLALPLVPVPVGHAFPRSPGPAHVTVLSDVRIDAGRPGAVLVLGRLLLTELDGTVALPVASIPLGTPEAGPVSAEGAVRALQALGTDATVIGGWGVDALLGRQTREHHDLDVLLDVTGLDGLLARADAADRELAAGAVDGSGAIAGIPVRCATREAQLAMHTGCELPRHQGADLELLGAPTSARR